MNAAMTYCECGCWCERVTRKHLRYGMCLRCWRGTHVEDMVCVVIQGGAINVY